MFNFQCVCFSSVFVYVCQCFSLNALCQPGCACSITKHFPVYFCPKVKSYDHFDSPSARKLTFWSAQMPCCLPVCQSVEIREKTSISILNPVHQGNAAFLLFCFCLQRSVDIAVFKVLTSQLCLYTVLNMDVVRWDVTHQSYGFQGAACFLISRPVNFKQGVEGIGCFTLLVKKKCQLVTPGDCRNKSFIKSSITPTIHVQPDTAFILTSNHLGEDYIFIATFPTSDSS